MQNKIEAGYFEIMLLLRHCDNRKVHYRHQNNLLAEKLFSYLEAKLGMMVDYIAICIMEENTFG